MKTTFDLLRIRPALQDGRDRVHQSGGAARVEISAVTLRDKSGVSVVLRPAQRPTRLPPTPAADGARL